MGRPLADAIIEGGPCLSVLCAEGGPEAGASGRGSPRGVHDLAGLSMNERRGITADTALSFARYFKSAPAFWMTLQTRHDLELA